MTPVSHPPVFYAKVAGICFVAGGLMELFMIKTGFYEKVTAIEAERLEGEREQRVAFERQLRAEVERQARLKNVTVKLPPPLSPSSSTLPPPPPTRPEGLE